MIDICIYCGALYDEFGNCDDCGSYYNHTEDDECTDEDEPKDADALRYQGRLQ